MSEIALSMLTELVKGIYFRSKISSTNVFASLMPACPQCVPGVCCRRVGGLNSRV